MPMQLNITKEQRRSIARTIGELDEHVDALQLKRSPLAEALARSRVRRIERLKDQIARGEYEVDAMKVAESMIRHRRARTG
jgi:anti-sigma28 factor (negative regulator of flagellin synthesis)